MYLVKRIALLMYLITLYIAIVAVQERMSRINSDCICPFQFYSSNGSLNQAQNYHYKLVASGNLYMTSKNLPGNRDDESFGDCTWLAGTAFQTRNVFEKVLIMDNNIVINQTTHAFKCVQML